MTRLATVRAPRRPQAAAADWLPQARIYDASATGRRLGGWDAPAASPRRAAIAEIDRIRRRSRAAARNSPWIRRGLDAAVADEIGTGIVPRFRAPDGYGEAMRQLYRQWLPHADADGALDFYGLMALAVRSRRESGEVFARIRRRRQSDGLPVPLQIQLLEADYCPAHYHRDLGGGREIVSGIELDVIGRRVAYWMHRRHPDDGGHLADLVRVPADEVIHLYRPLRPGQLRGEPETTQALVRAYQYDQYDDAELERKKTRAAYTGTIERPDPGENDWQYDPITGEELGYDAAGDPVTETQPGQFTALLPGEKINLFEGDNTGSGYKDFSRHQLLGIAAGLGMPVEVISQDYSNINDRTWRATVQQYRRELEQVREQQTIHQFCRPIIQAWIDRAVLSGALRVPDYGERRAQYQRVEWRPQAWPHIHPLQDVQADKKAVDAGFDSRQSVVARRGRDAEDVDQERAEDLAREESLGLGENDE
ncbi:phage portal protein, lambda family [Thiohalospira halophila DSM 15071]|uniref:Phage portal protein, lambda family n=1 Tax=Thiohalospira halophila DSM 15071 TaxID=1123397 RepID=A0A1I1UG86_9GAMM|nr:phage portal protein [Thiohalospira halophila]SFD67773.1 phage portal protein, lambda family [Thiohalospira halophila DSM 15071]